MEKDVDINKIIDKVRKLLAKADKRSNDNDAEAQSAALMAQKLMAEYNISMSDASEVSQRQPVVHVAARTKWDMGFRKPLAHIIADNFRCVSLLAGKSVIFIGTPVDVSIARETFEYIYEFVLTAANRQYSRALAQGRQTKGVFNSYALGFLSALKDKLDEQCRALMIIRPPEVDEFVNKLPTKDGKAHTMKVTDFSAYKEGQHDGSTILSSKGRLT